MGYAWITKASIAIQRSNAAIVMGTFEPGTIQSGNPDVVDTIFYYINL